MRKQYTEAEVIDALRKKHDVQEIDPIEKTIIVLKGEQASNDLGNGSWGKIDFLTHVCKYSLIRTNG